MDSTIYDLAETYNVPIPLLKRALHGIEAFIASKENESCGPMAWFAMGYSEGIQAKGHDRTRLLQWFARGYNEGIGGKKETPKPHVTLCPE